MVAGERCHRLDQVVSAWACTQPNACAATIDRERYSYAYLDGCVGWLANALVAAGVTRGDRIAVLQTPHPEFLVTLLAVSSVGAIWVGLNPKYTKAELVSLAADCQPRLLITRTRVRGRVRRRDRRVVGLCRYTRASPHL